MDAPAVVAVSSLREFFREHLRDAAERQHLTQAAAALYLSLLACLRNMRAMMLYGLALMIPLFFFTRAGMLIGQVDLGLWMLAPLIVPSIYASYRDVFVPTPPPAEAPANP